MRLVGTTFCAAVIVSCLLGVSTGGAADSPAADQIERKPGLEGDRAGAAPTLVQTQAVTAPARPDAATSPSEGSDLVVGAEENGKTVRLEVGRKLTIRLAGNPTTGYEWQPIRIGSDALRSLGDAEFVPNPETEGMLGAGGTYLFRLEAVRSGKAVVRTDYRRIWEKGKPPAETFQVTVEIR